MQQPKNMKEYIHTEQIMENIRAGEIIKASEKLNLCLKHIPSKDLKDEITVLLFRINYVCSKIRNGAINTDEEFRMISQLVPSIVDVVKKIENDLGNSQ